MLQHLLANSYALRGPGAYNAVIRVYGGLPFVAVLEVALIYVPLLYHSIYGIWISAYGQANLTKYAYGRNWMYFLQRASGLVALVYISVHVWDTSIHNYNRALARQSEPGNGDQLPGDVAPNGEPVAILAASRRHCRDRVPFHQRPVELLHPLGLTISAQAQRTNQFVCWGLFAVFAGMGLWTIAHLRADGLKHIASASPVVAVTQH